jgi:hypothetical protein
MKVIQVENLIEIQSQKHRERLLSQFSRLLDSSPSFLQYYSIDGVNSTVEIGSRDIMQYVGSDSPVKFKKIKNLPMYSLQVIDAAISYDDILGTYTEYEGEGLELQSLIQPYPGDHFIIPAFNTQIIFAITDVKIRAVRGMDHYVVNYTLIPTSRIKNIEAQVIDNYTCIFRNIGTEDSPIIRDDMYNLLAKSIDVYNTMMIRYLDENYDNNISYMKTPEGLRSELNVDIGNGSCKYLMKFLMDNNIIYFDEVTENVFAFEDPLPFESQHNKLYNRTFPLLKFINNNFSADGDIYVVFRSLPISLFREIDDYNIVQSIEFLTVDPIDGVPQTFNYIKLLTKDFLQRCISNTYGSDLTPLQTIIIKVYNAADITIDEYKSVIEDYAVSDLFRFYFIPYILFSLKIQIKSLQTR